MALRAVNRGSTPQNVLTMRMSLTEPQLHKERRRRSDWCAPASSVCARCRASRRRARPAACRWRAATGCRSKSSGGRSTATARSTAAAAGTPISPGYFDVFKIPMLRGRDFTDRDAAAPAAWSIINQAMAQQFWPKGDPLTRSDRDRQRASGRRSPKGRGRSSASSATCATAALNQDPQPAMYVPLAQVPDALNALNARLTPLGWVVRTRGEPHALSAAIQKELRQASGGLPVARISRWTRSSSRSTARSDFNMLLMTVFGGAALLLAAIGIYGLMAYSVEQRTQEIGIRLALGAELGQVRNMVIVAGHEPRRSPASRSAWRQRLRCRG